KGPSMTVVFPPENLMRAPLEVGCSPSPASMTPALTISSLNFPMSARIFWSGMIPASDSLFAGTMAMKRIVGSPFEGLNSRQGSRTAFERHNPDSTYASNKAEQDRQAFGISWTSCKWRQDTDLVHWH